ncbi:hypothetical protein SAMN05421870_1032 [Streptomyces qinglanensis]|uniref:Uncharacterized protein n=1 Tax=Streptomyces qinglanensis TaxID=943816 RepID=A0A1H9QMM5_9ACTN|nr:hypothetical protein SAMN05421870_1032 [Streptomyces qinglanensis]
MTTARRPLGTGPAPAAPPDHDRPAERRLPAERAVDAEYQEPREQLHDETPRRRKLGGGRP